MKMDRISLDLGLDLTMDALVARAEQLVHHEVGTVAEKSSHVYNLQRKVCKIFVVYILARMVFSPKDCEKPTPVLLSYPII